MADESRDIWRRIATWWDEQIGEGNDFQRQLIMPATDKLLQIQPGEHVLDVCCGNGSYARMLSRRGAHVLAVDGAEGFIDRARERTSATDGNITYGVVDATDADALCALGKHWFDAAVCSMAIMDLPTIGPLLSALRILLKPGGRFVFSVSHPCFNSIGSRMTAELSQEGHFKQHFGVSVMHYIDGTSALSAGIRHQPEPHYTFHRSLSTLFNACFKHGWVIDGFEEPTYPKSTGGNAFSWKKRPQLPPAIVVRVK